MNILGLSLQPKFWLTRSENSQQQTANAAWLMLDKSLRLVIGVTIGIWIARYLGVQAFGQLSYAIAFVSLFSAVATLGLDKIVVRDLVRHPDLKDEILGSTFIAKLTGGAVAMGLTLICIRLIEPDDTLTQTMVSIIAAGMIFQATDTADLWFQSRVQSKYTVFAKSSAFLLLSLVKVALILTGAGLLAFAWAALAEIVIASIGMLVTFRAVGNPFSQLRASAARAKQLLAESWPYLLSGLAIMLYMRIDQVMLGKLAGTAEVGLYSAALRLSEAWYIIPTIIVSTLMPAVTRAKSTSLDDYYLIQKRLFIGLAGIAYLVAIPMTIFSTPLITLLFGAEYSGAGPVLAIHIWAALFVFLGVATSPWVANEGLARYRLYCTAAGAALNIFLNYLLIPGYGALGCALATTLSYGFSAWLANALSSKTRK
ncbi:MAG: flippase, partial [Gammaproteobacteria bacterium]|nr:flippase [Gammaproteobacteria bacterium]